MSVIDQIHYLSSHHSFKRKKKQKIIVIEIFEICTAWYINYVHIGGLIQEFLIWFQLF